MGPPAYNDLFKPFVLKRALRSSDQLSIVCPPSMSQFGDRNFGIRGCLYWNVLPLELNSSTSAESFKAKLKMYHDLIYVPGRLIWSASLLY